ncbi:MULTISPECIES: sulfite exporter TauE/SafE family protein [Actinomyces]|uniref:sulfite exporter TauE/SafE family protein n=1 Tax=Actinomyces TaxID=1654 RepID=UPI0009810C70|nr:MULTISPECIES: sulfite exporter TauE/SafE family protein [Actinomyces]
MGTTTAWALLIVSALLVGLSKTALPGVTTIAVAMFAQVLPAKESTGVMLLLLLTGDLPAIWAYRRDADATMLKRLVPAVACGVLIGALFLRVASDDLMRRVIGWLLIALIVITLAQRARGRRRGGPTARAASAGAPSGGTGSASRAGSSPMARMVYGALAGFSTMVANAGGPVTSLYFLACRYPVKAFLGTTAWFFFLVNLTKLPFSIALGIIHVDALALVAILIPAVLVGALAGRLLADRMPQRVFDPIVMVLTVVAALPLLA